METKKQTAVEWLEEQRKWSVITNEHIEQALVMEKEQIIDAFINGSCDCQKLLMDSDVKKYYNETYGK